jgi:hypothetical protein
VSVLFYKYTKIYFQHAIDIRFNTFNEFGGLIKGIINFQEEILFQTYFKHILNRTKQLLNQS